MHHADRLLERKRMWPRVREIEAARRIERQVVWGSDWLTVALRRSGIENITVWVTEASAGLEGHY